jgi:hypothetical protein
MKKSFFKILFSIAIFALSFSSAQAAILYLSPASGQYTALSTIPVKVYVNSAGTTINAIESSIKYPADILEVKSISKASSLIQLWSKEPSFSNESGLASYSGGVPSLGFTGTGITLTINFLAKKEGEATVYFSSGIVLAADGRGTDVLTSKSGAKFSIKAPTSPITPEKPKESAKPAEKEKKKRETPGGIEIASTTHPIQDQWYNENNISLNWKITSEYSGESFEFDQNPDTIPDQISEGFVDSKKYEGVNDGIWYFHLRLKNEIGWGEVSSYKIQIDKEPPRDLTNRIDNGGDLTNPQPALFIEAMDDLSGISHYEIKIENGDFLTAVPSKASPLILPLQSPGTKYIDLIAYDRAGNIKSEKIQIEISSIEVPIITTIPDVYNSGEEILYIEGRAMPNTIVILYLKKEDEIVKKWEIVCDGNGNWQFTTEELFQSGEYKIQAQTRDARGAISNFSEEHNLKIILNGFAIGSFLIDYWTMIMILIILIALLIILFVIFVLREKKEHKKIDKEVREARESLKATFNLLRKKIEKRIKSIDSRPGFRKEEKEIRNDIFKILNSSEKIVEKEIKDIEDELS